MSLFLKEVSKESFYHVVSLEVADEQIGLVADNMQTVAEAYIEPTLTPYAIYVGDRIVGLIASYVDLENEERKYWLPRLMIDRLEQKQGYAKQAVATLIAYMTLQFEDCTHIYCSIATHNENAVGFFSQFGFTETGETNDNEKLYVLQVK